MKKTQSPKAKGSWRAFGRMVWRIDLPWLMILLAFISNITYQEFLLSLPTTAAALMSGSLETSALWDAVWYYLLYGVVIAVDIALLGIACRLSVRNARTKIWGRMMRVNVDYYDSHTPAALLSAVTNDLDESVGLLVRLIVNFIPTCYYLVRAMLKISDYDPLLTVSVLISLPLQYLYMVVVGKWNFKVQAGIFGRIGQLTGYLAERVKNLPLIKYYGTEDQERGNGQAASKDLYEANMYGAKKECAATGISTVISIVQSIVVMMFGVVLLQAGRIDMGQWIAFFMFSGNITSSFMGIVESWQRLKTIQGQTARVAELVDAPVEQSEAQTKQPVRSENSSCAPSICFENVSFAYGEKQALRDISFTIPSGTATAIVGLTGSGKTTSLNLLENFYQSSKGRVLLDGQEVHTMPLQRLRGSFSYVQQDAGIFSGTVREVMCYGLHRQVTNEELEQAAKISGAWEFICQLPEKFDSLISVGGESLSGGQRQRLVLAREFLRNADVLLLDEPTSALDSKTAAAVEETIFRMFRGKTIVMVTHDMSLLRRMDQIIVLQEGQLVGQGTYTEVLESCQLFREMVHTQHGGEAVL